MKKFLTYTIMNTTPSSVHADSFIAFGDWGMPTKDFNSSIQKLFKYKNETNFTVLLGDNFYDNGVKSTSDQLFKLYERFQQSAPVFYSVLGNHDYGGSVDAQSAYTFQNPTWQMPARYYYRMIPQGGTMLCAIFLDTYFFDKYQLNWFNLVAGSSNCQRKSVFRVVFAHYPIHTVGLFARDDAIADLRARLKPALQDHRVHAYVAGHEHDMQAFRENGIHYVISGAFSDKYTKDTTNGKDPTLFYRSFNLAAFARFRLPSHNLMTYEVIDSYSGDVLYHDSISVDGNWTVSGIKSTTSALSLIYAIHLLFTVQ